MKKILLTGGSGLLATNWAIQKRDTCDVVLGFHERIVSIKGVQSVLVNLTSPELFGNNLDKIKPDLVIHTAALSNVDYCEKEPSVAAQVNIGLSGNVAVACSERSIPLVHISTDHLFSGDKQFVSETDDVQPLNIYAQTKADAERKVIQLYPSALIIRTNFFGWGTSYRRSFSDEVLATLRNRQAKNLFDDVYYSPIVISELVDAVHELSQKKESGIFHVSSKDRISKYTFGIALSEIFGLNNSVLKRGSISERPELVRRPKDMSLSNAKLEAVLGRGMGDVKDHLQKLFEQEKQGVANELQQL